MFLCTYVYFFFKEKSYVYFHFSIKCPVIFPLSVYSFRAHGWAGLMVQPEGRIASARSDSAMGKGNTSPELETLHKATTGCGLFCICRFRRHETHAKWHILTSFCSQELWGLIFLSPEPWAGGGRYGDRCGAGTPHSWDIPPEFLSTAWGCGTCLTSSLPLQLVWMNVVSLIP